MSDAATPETATAPEVHDLASATRAIERIIRRDESPEVESGGIQTGDANGPDEAGFARLNCRRSRAGSLRGSSERSPKCHIRATTLG